jgi:hypothetical protein
MRKFVFLVLFCLCAIGCFLVVGDADAGCGGSGRGRIFGRIADRRAARQGASASSCGSSATAAACSTGSCAVPQAPAQVIPTPPKIMPKGNSDVTPVPSSDLAAVRAQIMSLLDRLDAIEKARAVASQ